MGRRQARAYCKQQQFKFELKPSATRFRFEDVTFSSLGIMEVRIHARIGSFQKCPMDIVSADIPMLLGLNILDRDGLIADNIRNELKSAYHSWLIPIERKFGHLYVIWNSKPILFTRQEPIKLHRHFRHPSPEKLYTRYKTGYTRSGRRSDSKFAC